MECSSQQLRQGAFCVPRNFGRLWSNVWNRGFSVFKSRPCQGARLVPSEFQQPHHSTANQGAKLRDAKDEGIYGSVLIKQCLGLDSWAGGGRFQTSNPAELSWDQPRARGIWGPSTHGWGMASSLPPRKEAQHEISSSLGISACFTFSVEVFNPIKKISEGLPIECSFALTCGVRLWRFLGV